MNNKLDQVPEEFKKLAEDFGKNGFITTSLDNLINWSRSGSLHWSFKNRPRCSNGAVGDGGDCVKTRMLETLPNGVAHEVLDIGRAYTDDTAVFTVPEGHFFFMGDNRDNSLDSRVKQVQGGVGFVPYEDLIGRADRIMFSSAGRSMLFFWTWRGDRFFQAIN